MGVAPTDPKEPHPRLVSVEGDGRLLDVCDETRAPVAFSCRGARCGTCCLDVIAGAELLEPAAEDEIETLAVVAAPRGARLACQVVVRRGPGLVRLRSRCW